MTLIPYLVADQVAQLRNYAVAGCDRVRAEDRATAKGTRSATDTVKDIVRSVRVLTPAGLVSQIEAQDGSKVAVQSCAI